MKTKKGDLWKCSNPKNRGLSNNFWYYCVMSEDNNYMMTRAIITQKGEILIDDQNIERWKGEKQFEEYDLIPTTVKEFLDTKDEFYENQLISFKHPKYKHGIIRSNNLLRETLTVEVEDEDDHYIIISFDDVTIVYPEFTFNNRKSFNKI